MSSEVSEFQEVKQMSFAFEHLTLQQLRPGQVNGHSIARCRDPASLAYRNMCCREALLGSTIRLCINAAT